MQAVTCGRGMPLSSCSFSVLSPHPQGTLKEIYGLSFMDKQEGGKVQHTAVRKSLETEMWSLLLA